MKIMYKGMNAPAEASRQTYRFLNTYSYDTSNSI